MTAVRLAIALAIAMAIVGCAAPAPLESHPVSISTEYDPQRTQEDDRAAGPPTGSPAPGGLVLIEFQALLAACPAPCEPRSVASSGTLLPEGDHARYALTLDDEGRGSTRVRADAVHATVMQLSGAASPTCDLVGRRVNVTVEGPAQVVLRYGLACA